MTTDSSTVEEPPLIVQPPPPAFYVRKRFLVPFTPPAILAVVGIVVLFVSGNLFLPFEPVVTLKGEMASKAEYFEDDTVKELLLKHRIRVEVTKTQGSRDVATHETEGYDFVFPSGQPAADLLIGKLRESGKSPKVHQPFVTPLVLPTYRAYAEALRGAGAATPRGGQGAPGNLYYDLDLARFLDLAEQNRSWNSIGIERLGTTNGTTILAKTPNMCEANSAGTYVAMVASIRNNGRVPRNDGEVTVLAGKINELVKAQGLTAGEMMRSYGTPEGKSIAPVLVAYEHQYFAYQLSYQARTGQADTDRVLLYPTPGVLTQPQLIALDENGDRLGRLLTEDPALRRRAMELGFRVLDPSATTSSQRLWEFLTERGIPVPAPQADETSARIPDLNQLEMLLNQVGGCR
ncbi:hypothetical protein [Amycolatopsis sp. NPDC059021]|uniref:hypothetical protein n=1 Tax=Amycolatopsis sp. NPDC059021 TaxID=3346704 RepID=UPI0036714827